MSSSTLYAVLLIAIGLFYLINAIRSLRDPEYTKKYLASSPKAAMWRKMWGEEKLLRVATKYFIPIGAFVSVSFIVTGLVILFRGLGR